VRQTAAHTLGERRDESAIPALLQALDDSDSDVREEVADALSQIGAVCVPGLLAQTSHRDQHTRIAAIRALGQIGDPLAITTLVRALDDESAWVRAAAAEALGALVAVDAVKPLIARLSDPDRAVQQSARIALQRIGTDEALDALL
jgi:HEAT repeat protein